MPCGGLLVVRGPLGSIARAIGVAGQRETSHGPVAVEGVVDTPLPPPRPRARPTAAPTRTAGMRTTCTSRTGTGTCAKCLCSRRNACLPVPWSATTFKPSPLRRSRRRRPATTDTRLTINVRPARRSRRSRRITRCSVDTDGTRAPPPAAASRGHSSTAPPPSSPDTAYPRRADAPTCPVVFTHSTQPNTPHSETPAPRRQDPLTPPPTPTQKGRTCRAG